MSLQRFVWVGIPEQDLAFISLEGKETKNMFYNKPIINHILLIPFTFIKTPGTINKSMKLIA